MGNRMRQESGTSIGKSRPIDRLLLPFRMFVEAEASSGILLLTAAFVAMIWANSAWSELYVHLWETEIAIGIGGAVLSESLLHWINDGLMAIFFFVVGLEIKRELIVGELSTPKLAALPLVAAFGGMVVPAFIYVAINFGTPEVRGWGIPMATDIAFSLGVLYLLGNRVPAGLKVFLAALAIADDIGAVIAIAVFYSSGISWTYLALGGMGLCVLALLNRLGVRTPIAYGVIGAGIWFVFLLSGVHPTVAGVLAAMTIPARARLDPREFLERSRAAINSFERSGEFGDDILTNTDRQEALLEIDVAYEETTTPLQRLEQDLHPWVSFLVLPLFALANAGVTFEGDISAIILHPVTIGAALGLLAGKQAGITFFAWLAVRLGWASLPAGCTWQHIWGVAWIAGIGFTMSIFIATLAFDDPSFLPMAKVGVFGASLLAGIIGVLVLKRASRSAG